MVLGPHLEAHPHDPPGQTQVVKTGGKHSDEYHHGGWQRGFKKSDSWLRYQHKDDKIWRMGKDHVRQFHYNMKEHFYTQI